MKVIISDANSRKAFDIINILKKVYQYDLLLFSSAGYQFQLPLLYGQQVHRLRSKKYSEFREDLTKVLKYEANEEYIYLPIAEEATLSFYQFVEEDFDYNIKYLLPDRHIFELVRDKKKFQAFCEEKKMPVPASHTTNTVSLLKDNFQPVIAKKKIGAGSVGIKYIEKPEQLSELTQINDEEYLIQEKVESNTKICGGFYLCKAGEVKVYHGHERIRTFPEKGGVTVFSKAAYNDELKKIGESLLSELEWDGLAMIEYLYDDNAGEWKIIELNPRLWGSVMLTEFCQSEMLNKYISLARNKTVKASAVKTERYIRWVFPFELINLLKGSINLSEFFNRSNKETCYINFTYSSLLSAFLFQFYFTFNSRSIKRFFKKVFL